MSGDILQRLIVDRIPSSLPSTSHTVLASQVPILFREPYILSGYRPIQQNWLCYLQSLFQKHNETLNVWTHLLFCPVLLLRWWANIGALGYTLDAACLPLILYLLSAFAYLLLSVAAHLFQSHSEHTHYFFFFMDYVGVAVHQYGCALGHYFYTSEPAWRESSIGPLYLPGIAFFAWLSCGGCCFAKSRYQRPYPIQRKICQLIPNSLSYFLCISPVVHRLFTVSWTQEPCLHFYTLQIALFLLSALFFSCHIPECYFPGRCDFVGQAHQIFHVLLGLSTVFQLEALSQDYARRRDTVVEVFGEKQLWWACVSLATLFMSSILIALISMWYMTKKLQGTEERDK
ncbi:LOW QUALITY PROTEIN: membrane progestin receptor beta [Pseudochaenichthys georgianus]|uniref:LOW QUALITY PROTEIN: membrane progestin receptor beta n=1 Tax=Pseudochaenichthys georgianus TaxID=52239 RepID=UPI00146A8895|nr:LOW QUALITY PROTEIN: membrane progestin receptor beta [Pseudochaenichthys georgianus]